MKKKKGGKKAGEASDTESMSQAEETQAPTREETPARQETPVRQEAPAKQENREPLKLDQSLFQPFNLGDVKKIQSTPDHQVIHIMA